MSIFDLAQRADILLKKYEKYDAALETGKTKSTDPFTDELQEIEAEVNKLGEAAADIQIENERAVIAQKYGEIRRCKAVLIKEALPELEKKLKKGKGVTKDIIAQRKEQFRELEEKIYAIPDGRSAQTRRPTRYGKGKEDWGGKHNPILLDAEGKGAQVSKNPLYWQHTEETQGFEKETQMRFQAQDEQLDQIAVGVSRLGEIARNMQEEVDRQNPIIDDIEAQTEKVTSQLKVNNAKLKGLVQQMRSSRNFCVDVILICIILAIGGYIYAMFKK